MEEGLASMEEPEVMEGLPRVRMGLKALAEALMVEAEALRQLEV